MSQASTPSYFLVIEDKCINITDKSSLLDIVGSINAAKAYVPLEVFNENVTERYAHIDGDVKSHRFIMDLIYEFHDDYFADEKGDYRMISDFLYADGFLTARNEDIIMLSDSSLGSMFSDFLSVDVRRSENIVRNYKPFLVKYGEIDPVTSDIIFMMNNSRKIIKMKFGHNDKRGEMVIVKSTAFSSVKWFIFDLSSF